jgi:hypothetical protein
MRQYEMSQLGPEVVLLDHLFLTREKGEMAYPFLKEQLQATAEGQALVLVFPAGQLVDASFADETIIRLGEELIAGSYGGRGLYLEGLTDNSQRNINAVIRLRHVKLAFLHLRPDNTWQILGQLEPSLQETLELVAKRGRLTAPTLAGMLDFAVNSASNRLKRLFDLHLVYREFEVSSQGLEYIYLCWQ